MYVLDALWRGEISPNEKCSRKDGDYHKLMERLCEVAEKLEAELSDNGKAYLKEYDQIQGDLILVENQEVFIDAFRMGARLILDVVEDRKGEFVYSAEM